MFKLVYGKQYWKHVASGASIPETAKKIREAGLKDLTLIDKRGNERVINADVRAKMIARTETAEAYTSASLQSYYDNGVTSYGIQTAEDDLVCLDCLEAAFEANTVIENMQQVIDNDYGMKEHPLTLVMDGVVGDAPPLHPNCYDKETMVYTKSGWKFFKDVSLEDEFLSLNPETNTTEFLKPVRIFKHYNTIDMIHVFNDEIDFLVTLDHDCFVNKNGEPCFIKAFELADDYSIYKSSNQLISIKDCIIEYVPYNDMVYCVELPKYHTLLGYEEW